jgi:phosphomannomutase
MSLEEYTDRELKDELEKREILREKKPLPYSDIRNSALLKPIVSATEAYLQEIKAGSDNHDLKQYIFEVVMDTFYGKDVWLWISVHATYLKVAEK